MRPDVLVVGGGLIGWWVALELAARDVRVQVLDAGEPGAASPVGAGMLAPSVERASGAAQTALLAARDSYGAALARLRDWSGVAVPFTQEGILSVPADDAEAATLRTSAEADDQWLSPAEVRALDAGYRAPLGALWHRRDGAVDPVPMLAALKRAGGRIGRVASLAGRATARVPGGVRLEDGTTLSAAAVVLAAGAWSGQLAALATPVPVFPMRGQMLELPTVATRLVAYGGGGYLVPRADGRTYVGATMEAVGFDPSTTPEGADRLARTAATLAPALAGVAPVRHAAALRPMTPDHLPLLGPSLAAPEFWFACGHGRNGILLAPLTGAVVAAGLTGAALPVDISPFTPYRFTVTA